MNSNLTKDRVLLARLQGDVERNITRKFLPIMEEQTNRIDHIETVLESQVFLTSAQAHALNRAVRQRVWDVCGNDDTIKRKMYQSLWHSLKEVYQVAQYREIPRIYFNNAMQYVGDWQPLKLAS